MTVLEVLENAQYNLGSSNRLQMTIGMEQLNNAMKAIANGKGLDDEYEEVE